MKGKKLLQSMLDSENKDGRTLYPETDDGPVAYRKENLEPRMIGSIMCPILVLGYFMIP